MGGLGQIFSIAGDPERDGFGCHGCRGMMPMTAQFVVPAKLGSTVLNQPVEDQHVQRDQEDQ
jgi:hypothetical protein